MKRQQPGSASVRVIVVMGVSGSGKTTIGALLAGRLRWEFAEADNFHSAANIAKMHSGTPLDDADREPWLRAIAKQIDAWRQAGQNGVITCSALKRSYRDIIIGDREDVRLVYLKGDQSLIAQRLVGRHEHFMPASLLSSQFDVLEEPAPDEDPLIVNIGQPPRALVEEIVATLTTEEGVRVASRPASGD